MYDTLVRTLNSDVLGWELLGGYWEASLATSISGNQGLATEKLVGSYWGYLEANNVSGNRLAFSRKQERTPQAQAVFGENSAAITIYFLLYLFIYLIVCLFIYSFIINS